MAVGTALLAASVGQSLFSAFSGNRKEKRMRKNKSSFFDTQLAPLLNEATQDQNVDLSSIFNAEMQMPLLNVQEGMRSLTRQRDQSQGQSGFQSSAFIDRDFNDNSNVIQNQFENQKFGVQRGLIDLQSQLESIGTENRIRAKELEYQFKFS